MGAAIPPWSISTVGTRGEAAPGAERRLREKTGRAPMRINKPQIGSSKEELMLRRGCQVPRGEERGTSSDFRSAPSCASHPSSKMEPALALLHPSTFGGKISEHPSGLWGAQPCPGSTTACSCQTRDLHHARVCSVMPAAGWGPIWAAASRAQLYSWLLIRAGLGKQLAASPGTPESHCQPKASLQGKHRGSLLAGQEQPHSPVSI